MITILRHFVIALVLGGLVAGRCLATANSPPVAVDDFASVAEGGTVTLLNSSGSKQFVWELRSSFLDPRTSSGVEGASASLIGSQIYVSHGDRFGDTSGLSIYDILGDSWTHGGPSAPNATVARSEMAGGTAFGKHYAIGGRVARNEVEEFDPSSGMWSSKAPLNLARGGLGVAS